jgi:hypothetical protein
MMSMASPDWNIILTAIVAIYGAALSTFTAIRNHYEKTRRLKSALSWGVLTRDDSLSEPMFILSASNPGSQAVTISTCYIRLPDNRQLLSVHQDGEVPLPHTVESAQSCKFWYPVRDVVEAIQEFNYSGDIKIYAVFRDVTDKEYVSRPFKGNVQEWARVGSH